MIAIVAATANSGVIGSKNSIPWRLKSDLVHLKELTLGRPVILGRKTYESMSGYYARSGRQMPGGLYIILTRDSGYRAPESNVVVASSILSAIDRARQYDNSGDIYVIGGAQIYQESMPYADKLYLTQVHAEIDGDTFFPEINSEDWITVSRESHTADAQNEYDFDFVVMERVSG